MSFQRSLRKVSLLVVLVLALTLMSANQVAGQEEHVEAAQEAVKDVVEEHVAAAEEAVQEKVEEVREAVEEQVHETSAEHVEEVVEEVEGAVSNAKGKLGKAVGGVKDKIVAVADKVVQESKSLVDKVKGMKKADAKKVAAAALGVWGVSVGVGWLAHTAKAGTTTNGNGAAKKKPGFGKK